MIVTAGCGPQSGGSTPAASSQPAGTPTIYGWNGVDNRMEMTGVVHNLYTSPSGAVDKKTWTFGGGQWAVASSAQALPAVQGFQGLLVYDSNSRREFLLLIPAAGGAPQDAKNAVWAWDGHSWSQQATSNGPQFATQSVSAAYSPDLQEVVLYDPGFGMGGGQTTWVYSGADWRPLTTAHAPLYAGFLNYDPGRHAVVALDSHYQTWVFDGRDWSQLPLSGGLTPVLSSGMGRQGPAIAFDPSHEDWVVFSGFDGMNWFDDTWTGDETSWTQRSPRLSPNARTGWPGRSLMAWDPALKRLILFGGMFHGFASTDFGDTWSWDGSAWKQLAGPSYSPVPSPSQMPTVLPASAPRVISPPPLIRPASSIVFAVTEGGNYQTQPNAVAIVGMDGYAKAKATFTPRTPPQIPDAFVPLQGVAQVVGSSLYYIDGKGVIRKLQAGGQPQTVATIVQPTNQAETWWAVSPDGSHVLAGVLTFPALGPVVSPAPWPTLVGPWKFDLEAATAGGATTNLRHEEESAEPGDPSSVWKPMFPVAWMQAGAVGYVPPGVASQQGWFGGPMYLLDSNGTQVRQLGGVDCQSAVVSASGLIPCFQKEGPIDIRDQQGNSIWNPQTDNSLNVLTFSLSPDGQSFSDGVAVVTRAYGAVPMPAGFVVEGWLDNNTVVGRITGPNGQLGDLLWDSVGDSQHPQDFGFKGDFVATISQ